MAVAVEGARSIAVRIFFVKHQSESGRASGNSLSTLISRLTAIRGSLVQSHSDFRERILGLHPAYHQSAANLIHYLSLRQHDIRSLQDELAALGLSSLGRAEAHVMWTIDAVLAALQHLAGLDKETLDPCEYPDFREGKSLLERHTEALLGAAPPHRGVRIMATMPSEAAHDYLLVRDLVSHGMNCMRINCAHDTAEDWRRIIEHLKRARHEVSLPCRILMDLGGPKLRTGSVQPGPCVVVWHPRRDSYGQVTDPARIFLVPVGYKQVTHAGADAVLPVPGEWLAQVKAGERIHFKDARGKRRVLEMMGSAGHGRWARCDQTAYVVPGTSLLRVDIAGDEKRETLVGALPPRDGGILLRKGDFLLITREPLAGTVSAADSFEPEQSPATISCSLPEVLACVRTGERIWFDDGKIGGIVRDLESDALRVEITQVRPQGDHLQSDKGINLPDTHITLPALTARDAEDLKFIVGNADLVGMSFVRHERDIHQLQSCLRELDAAQMGIVLKIETRQAFERLPNLIFAAMRQHPIGVMIARGDLAVECGYERLAEIQEEILWICEAAHIPVIWATQVLESMAKRGQPSRAEITDAAMGERAECVMLNKGAHIVAAVSTLDDNLRRMENHQSKKSARLRQLPLRAMLETSES
jgi:pyruvate kinase